jgi:hypothetical protein
MTFYTMTTVGYGNIGLATDYQRMFAMVIMIVGAFL